MKRQRSKELDAEFKTLVIGMLNELSEDFNSIKKEPVRNEVYTN